MPVVVVHVECMCVCGCLGVCVCVCVCGSSGVRGCFRVADAQVFVMHNVMLWLC